MATTWQKLVENSSLPDNGNHTAWEHLCNQIQGVFSVMVCDETFVNVDDEVVEVVIEEESVEIVCEDEVIVEIDEDEVEIEVCQ